MKKLIAIFFLGLAVIACKEDKGDKKHTDNTAQKEDKVYLGYYPFWFEDLYKKTDFSGYTVVSYYSSRVNPENGMIEKLHEWETTPLVDTLKQHVIKSLFAVSNKGKGKNKAFLNNSKAIQQFFDRSVELIKLRQADGILIDFEDVDMAQKDAYTNFIVDLSNEMKKADSNYMLFVTIPFVDENKAIDILALNRSIDFFVLPPQDESNASYDLNESRKYYLTGGIPDNKLIQAKLIVTPE